MPERQRSRVGRNFLREVVSPSTVEIDIVAIHGLNPTNTKFHAEETWTASDGTTWLTHYQRLGFYYSAIIPMLQSNLRLPVSWSKRRTYWTIYMGDSHPFRPLVFICHSLGGLIAKQSLVTAKLTDTFSSIYLSTRGLVFFGTPHQGGHGAKLGDIAANDSEIESLRQNFRHLLDRFQVISFYETLPTAKKGIKLGVIVDRQSATLGISSQKERQILRDTDHIQICKYNDPAGDEFMQLANNLRRIFSEIPSISDLGFGSGLRRGVQAAKVPSARAELSKMVDVIDRLAAETRAGLRESSVMTTYDNDDKEIWRQFRRELIGEGFFSDDIWRFKGQLRQYLRVLNQNRLLEESIEESEVHVHDDLRFAFSNDVPEAQCYRQEPDKMKSAPFQTSRLTDETASSSVFSLDSRKQVECAGVLTKEETGSRADTGDSGHILDSSSTDDGYTDEEDEIADRALDRIRRARLLGRKDVRLSRRELLALEKKMDHQGLRGDREATGDGDKIANVLRWIFSENMGNA